jgi:hypothetical protein
LKLSAAREEYVCGGNSVLICGGAGLSGQEVGCVNGVPQPTKLTTSSPSITSKTSISLTLRNFSLVNAPLPGSLHSVCFDICGCGCGEPLFAYVILARPVNGEVRKAERGHDGKRDQHADV